jgi:hypothetical protein
LGGIFHIFFQEIFAEMKTKHIKLIYFWHPIFIYSLSQEVFAEMLALENLESFSQIPVYYIFPS